MARLPQGSSRTFAQIEPDSTRPSTVSKIIRKGRDPRRRQPRDSVGTPKAVDDVVVPQVQLDDLISGETEDQSGGSVDMPVEC